MININHPKDVGLSYSNHLIFAWYEAFRALGLFIVMMFHGIIPWIGGGAFTSYVTKAKARLDAF